ncbi:MAG: hypothetical protein AAGJ70_04795 [Pseudomonadota bacterium]
MSQFFGKLKQTFQQAPSGFPEFVFEFAALFGENLIRVPAVGQLISSTGRLISYILLAISPALPFDIKASNSFSEDPFNFYKKIFLYSFLITVFFCLILSGVLAFGSGTFFETVGPGLLGSTNNAANTVISFTEDFHNILLYAVVVPLYVSAAVCMIVTVVLSWSKINLYSRKIDETAYQEGFSSRHVFRIACFFSCSLLIASIFIANYIADLKDPVKTEHLYWFFDVAGSGERMINGVGSYYLFMNAMLLLITSVAALLYISISLEAFRLGRVIGKDADLLMELEAGEKLEVSLLQLDKRFRLIISDFSFCYIWAKVLLLAYVVNILIWQASPAGNVDNVHYALFLLVLIGLLFLVLPRLYLGSQWHKLKLSYLSVADTVGAEGLAILYTDIRSGSQQKISMLLNLMYASVLSIVLMRQYGVDSLLGLVGLLFL